MDPHASFTATQHHPMRERAHQVSVLCGVGYMAWCAHDVADGTCTALHAAAGDVLPALDQLPAKPASVTFTVLPEVGTLVPESALVAGSEGRYLSMVHGRMPAGTLRDEPLDELGARCLYVHDEAVERNVLHRFPAARSLPLQAVLVRGALARSTTGTVALLHRSEQRLDLAIARNGQLLLSNSFHATNAEDVLYFTLFAFEQLKLDVNTVDVHCGGTHLAAADMDLLRSYCANLSPVITMKDVPGLEARERWMALLLQFACAS